MFIVGLKNLLLPLEMLACAAHAVILNEDSVDHAKYIKQVLPIAKKYGNKMFGDDWTF
jgi:hypothetical protein